mmetsp:Transcript_100453/g.279731  ORF Transcript_100453/g.279731 Transcript_100453/m.279731 type:complete len:232 (+) Transcript_100453:1243-1938(+)
MRRDRLLTPLQEPEQSLQAPQSENAQSMVGSQLMSALQNSTSRSLPAAGVPHSVAICATLRVRNVTPPPQVCEQGDQPVQSDHLPSTHLTSLHGSVLQASISSLSWTSQALPPSLGATAICLSLLRWPPPQLELQLPHSDQPPQAQSVFSHCGLSRQAAASDRAAWQPRPSGFLLRSTLRYRRFWPTPQVVEHLSQAVQSPSSQSSMLQGMALQPRVCMISVGHASPPLAA